MRTIYKYEIPVDDRFTLELPNFAEILAFGQQGGTPMIWALVDPELTKLRRTFVLVGTGNPVPDDVIAENYIGTTQTGPFVWHLFELGRKHRVR